ncbi:hypothetical protein KGO95_02180 [Patescibacteria group bacterium]|nr:hypothetical protein [Patescibacteria group bacterium]
MDTRESLSSIATYVERRLGRKMMLYCAGCARNDWPKWPSVRLAVEMRIRYLHQITRILVEGYGVEKAKEWLEERSHVLERNRVLRDKVPRTAIRHAASIADLEEILAAAQAFVRP